MTFVNFNWIKYKFDDYIFPFNEPYYSLWIVYLLLSYCVKLLQYSDETNGHFISHIGSNITRIIKLSKYLTA